MPFSLPSRYALSLFLAFFAEILSRYWSGSSGFIISSSTKNYRDSTRQIVIKVLIHFQPSPRAIWQYPVAPVTSRGITHYVSFESPQRDNSANLNNTPYQIEFRVFQKMLSTLLQMEFSDDAFSDF